MDVLGFSLQHRAMARVNKFYNHFFTFIVAVNSLLLYAGFLLFISVDDGLSI